MPTMHEVQLALIPGEYNPHMLRLSGTDPFITITDIGLAQSSNLCIPCDGVVECINESVIVGVIYDDGAY